jgi:hypothetical protein
VSSLPQLGLSAVYAVKGKRGRGLAYQSVGKLHIELADVGRRMSVADRFWLLELHYRRLSRRTAKDGSYISARREGVGHSLQQSAFLGFFLVDSCRLYALVTGGGFPASGTGCVRAASAA